MIAAADLELAQLPPQKLIALTAWGEARGEGARGMQGVINVILNRASHARWWGTSPTEVCLRSHKGVYQFSCWSPGDPNRAKMLEVTAYNNLYREAYRLAGAALEGKLPDITLSADHYHSILIRTPAWAKGRLPTVFINNHVFYRLEI